MVLGALWLLIFTIGTIPAFFEALIDIVALLVSTLWMMMVISRSKLNLFESVTTYSAFSIYAGWVTSATILNFGFCLKGLGFSDQN